MSDVINVGMLGAAGRMGRLISRGLHADSGFSVGKLYDQVSGEVEDVGPITTSLDELLDSPVTHVVDFSLGPAVDANGAKVLAAGKRYVVGATGYAEETVEALRAAAEEAKVSCLIVPNFSIGANLMMDFSRRAAKFFRTAEITERHHPGKADSPSGTALATARLVADGGATNPGPLKESVAGVRGGGYGGVRLHSQRLPGVLAEQAVVFGADGETLTVEHRSISRESFLPGVKLALKAMGGFTGLRVGLDSVMEGLK
jgi:4-hydroxy-tetrahydrodipicolinate reductase